MKHIITGACLASLIGLPALAGGLDRSGLGISPIFESGDHAEFSFGIVAPSVTGGFPPILSSGDVAADYFSFGGAVKTDLNDKVSVALIFEEAYGAAADYTNASAAYPIPAFTATLSGKALSLVGRYKVSDRISVLGGLRYVSMSGSVDFSAAPGGAGPITYGSSGALGYLVGAAYEIPDIALRASLTYNSATTHNNPITGSGGVYGPGAAATGAYTMPQSVNFDFQTGIAANTLLMGSVRWANWTATTLNTQTALGAISYTNDVFTYSLGVGRRFSDTLSMAANVSYESAVPGTVSDLSPTNGKLGLTVAAVVSVSDNVKVTAGLNYTALGDATTTSTATFTGNSAIGAGVKVGISF